MGLNHEKQPPRYGAHFSLSSGIPQNTHNEPAEISGTPRETHYAQTACLNDLDHQQYAGISCPHPEQGGPQLHDRFSSLGPLTKTYPGPSTDYSGLTPEQKLSMWASLYPSGSSYGHESAAELVARGNCEVRIRSSDTIAIADSIPRQASVANAPRPLKAPNYATFSSNVSTIYRKSGPRNLRAGHGVPNNRSGKARAGYHAGYRAAICSTSTASDLGIQRVLPSNRVGDGRIDARSAASARRFTSVHPKAVAKYGTNGVTGSSSSYILSTTVVNDPSNGSASCSSYVHPKAVVNRGALPGTSSHVANGQTVGNAATKISGSRGNVDGRFYPASPTPPGTGRAPGASADRTEGGSSLRSGKAKQTIRSTDEAVTQGARGPRCNGALNCSVHRQEDPAIRRTITRKRHARTVRTAKSPAAPSHTRGLSKLRQLQPAVESTGVAAKRRTAGRTTTRRQKARKAPVPREPIVISHNPEMRPEPLVPQAVVPAQVAIPRRVPYPRPIVVPPPPPPEPEEDGDEAVILEGIAKRFGSIVDGYIWHRRSGWLMHPTFYDTEHPLCSMNWICRHSRDCHEVRKLMACMACIKEGVSFRESEYVWQVSRSCLQRNMVRYKYNSSLQFLLTPRK